MKVYSQSIQGLAKGDLSALKKNRKAVSKYSEEVDDLRNDLFYFIKNLDEETIKGASNFYINILAYLQDIAESLQYISKITYKHINNNHSKLTLNQIRDLLDIQKVVFEVFEIINSAFSNKSFGDIKSILKDRNKTVGILEDKIEAQISRTRTSEEKSPKNAALYFSILQESKDLMKEVMNLIEEYYVSYDKSVKPAKPNGE